MSCRNEKGRDAQELFHFVTKRVKDARMSVTVIFDLDGTLADTSLDLLNAANAVFEAEGHGRPLTHPEDAGTALRGGRAMLTLGTTRREGLGEAFIDAGYNPLLDFYAQNLDVHTTLYDNVVPALEALKNAGYNLGVCTNKPAWLAEPLLKSLGVWDMFGAMLGSDSLLVKKPDPEHLFETVRRAGGDPREPEGQERRPRPRFLQGSRQSGCRRPPSNR